MKKLIHAAAIAIVVLAATNQTKAQWTRNAASSQTYLTNTADNVGIGTTNPLFKLDIQSTAAASMSFKSTTGNANIILDRFNSSSTAGVNYRTNGVPFWQTGTLGTDNYGIRNIGITSTALTILYSNNNVGIGTSAPANKLSVAGSANVDGSLLVRNPTTVTAYGQLTHSGSPNGNFHIDAYGSGGTYINAYSGQGVYIGDGGISGTAVACFKTNGNIGIGTNTPNAPLQFSNSAVNRKVVLYDQNNNDNQYYGFGINGGTLRYQVDATAANHIFYAGTSATTSNELMRVTGTGNVGIGTSTPAAKLDVNGVTKTTGFQMPTGAGVNKVLTSDASGNASWQTPSGGSGQWTTSGNNIYNNNSGNVGIGTATPAANLAVKNTNLTGITAQAAMQIGELNVENMVFDMNEIQARNNGVASTLFLNNWGGNISMVNGTGNVGIGITAPSQKLDVAGTIKANNNIIVDGSASNNGALTGNNCLLFGGIASGEGIASKRTAGGNIYGLDFYTASTNRMSINSVGSVGIGTTSPACLLDVVSTASTGTSVLLRNTGTGDVGFGLRSNSGTTTQFIDFQDGATAPYTPAYRNRIASTNSKLSFSTNTVTDAMILLNNGNVGIGATPSSYKLEVCGTIRANEVRVETGWCDYVFANDYKLRPLAEVEAFIKENKHLPEVTPGAEIETNGLEVGKVSAQMIKKIEELTLYAIEQQKRIDDLQKQMEELKQDKR